MHYVYILKGEKHYIGRTNNIKRRLREHKRGSTYTTRRMKKWRLIGYVILNDEEKAKKLENEIKKSCHPERYICLKEFVKSVL